MSKKTVKILKRDDIRTANDLKRELVEIPEWGGSVYVRAMTAFERERFEESLIQGKGKKARMRLVYARARLATIVCEDEDGNPLFGENDIAWLAKKSAKALDRIFDVAGRLSGLNEEDVEDLVKNSEETPDA